MCRFDQSDCTGDPIVVGNLLCDFHSMRAIGFGLDEIGQCRR